MRKLFASCNLATGLRFKIDGSIQESIAGMLLRESRLSLHHKVAQVKVLQYFLRGLGELPVTTQRVAVLFAMDYLDIYFNEMHKLNTIGLEVGVHRNVQLMLSLAEGCNSFLYIDPIIYQNISDDWSQAWWGLLRSLKERPNIVKTYIVLNGPANSRNIEEDQRIFGQVQKLHDALKDHGFEVRYCDPRELRRVDPSIDLLSTAMSVIDRADIVLNTAKLQYTDEKMLGTRVLGADERYLRFIKMAVEYSQPVAAWPNPYRSKAPPSTKAQGSVGFQ